MNSPEWCMALLGMNMHRGFYTASGVFDLYAFSGTMTCNQHSVLVNHNFQ